MKSNLSKYLISALALVFAGIFTVSCINDSNDEPAPAPDTDPEPSMIRFSVADVKSRIIYDGEDYEKSAFEPGDTVGCFLRGESQWDGAPAHFRAYLFVVNDRNYLELRKVYDRLGGSQTQGKFINIEDAPILTNTGEHFMMRYNQHDAASGVADEYLYLTGTNEPYGFVFFYPAVSNELLAGDYQNARAKYDGTVPFYQLLDFPHASRADELPASENPCPFMPNWSFGAGFTTSLGAESSWNADIWSKAAPQEFPVFVNSCQIDKTKVQNSDFMYAFCLKDNGGNWINKNTSGTINVQLEKAFAAVELVCTDGYEATDVTIEGNPIILGKKFNFKYVHKDHYESWETPDYAVSDWTDRTGARQYTEFTGRILPWERVAKKRFRVVLPPQTVNEDMVINVTVNGQPHRISIHEVMRKNGVTDYKFESNKYYIIRFSPKYIEFIIRDWLDGPTTELDPIKPETEENQQ